MRDLGQVQSVLVEVDGQRYQLRTDLVGAAYKAFAAAGAVRLPRSPIWDRSAEPPTHTPKVCSANLFLAWLN